jgi:hypothetical protein
MTLLTNLIKKRGHVGIATAIPATSATQSGEKIAKIAKIATVAVANPQTHEIVELVSDTEQNTRRQKVLSMLEENPNKQRAVYADTESDQDNVILTIAVRHLATCEMLIPKDRYDPFRLLELIEQYTGSIH